SEHAAFYSSCKMTLNITRFAMAEMGYCPSGRLFEAAACGVPVLSDWWNGIDVFFEPGKEILIARDSESAMDAFNLSTNQLKHIGSAARERALAEHTADARALQLEQSLNLAYWGETSPHPPFEQNHTSQQTLDERVW